MNHLFVPYELAVKAKEKGFNEPCLAIFSIVDNSCDWMLTKHHHTNDDVNEYSYTSPLYQQLVYWFDKKGIYISLTFEEDKKEKGVYNYINMPYYTFEIRVKTYLHGGAIQSYLKFVDCSSDRYRTLNKALEEAFKLI